MLPGALALAQAPSGEGMQEGRPGIEEDRPAQPAAEHGGAQQFAVPIRIVEEPEEAERTRKREDDSDQREKDDLIEQRRAANAAERGATAAEWQKGPTIAQIVLAGFGTLGLLVALYFSYQSNKAAIRAAKAAEEAVKVTRETAQKQLRAYLSVEIDNDNPPGFYNAGVVARLKLVNRGQTPARNVMHSTTFGVYDHPLNCRLNRIKGNDPDRVKTTIGPNADLLVRLVHEGPLNADEIDGLLTGTKRIYVFGIALYRDVFNRRRYTRYRFALPVSPDGHIPGVHVCAEGNHSH